MDFLYICKRQIKKKKTDLNKIKQLREDKTMATMLLFSDAVTSAYKDTSKALKEVDLGDKKIVKKTLSQLMKQSFFHGANRYGTNFIA